MPFYSCPVTPVNRHRRGHRAFGDGVYCEEDVGKTDQYVGADSAHDPSNELHKRLYGKTVRHPCDVFSVLVVRAALGYPVRTQQMGKTATSRRCRASHHQSSTTR